jgi:hypothetical protein
MGALSETGADDKSTLLDGISPAIFNDPSGTDAQRIHLEHINVWERSLGKLKAHLSSPKFTRGEILPATLRKNAFSEKRAVEFTRDARYGYMMIEWGEWINWLNDTFEALDHIRPPSFVRPTPVGLKALFEDGRVEYPRRTVKIDEAWIRMKAVKPDLKKGIMREVAKQGIAHGAVLSKWADYRGYKNKWKLDRQDFEAFGVMSSGCYFGYNTNINDEISYTLDQDWYTGILPWCVMGHSELYGDLNYNGDNFGSTDSVKKMLWDIAVGFEYYRTKMKTGARLIPVRYDYVKGNIFTIKNRIRDTFTDLPLSMGGQSGPWMHPAERTNIKGVFFPSPVLRNKQNEYEMQIPENEEFTDFAVERGEGDMPNLKLLNSNLRMSASRDSRAEVVEEGGRRYIKLFWRLNPYPRKSRRTDIVEWLLSLVADGEARPGGAVWGAAGFNRTRYRYFLSSRGASIMTETGERRALPGGLLPTDESSIRAEETPGASRVEVRASVETRDETATPPPPGAQDPETGAPLRQAEVKPTK